MERQGQICQMIAPAVRQQIWGPVPIHPHHAHGGTPALRIWKCWRQMLVCSTINWDKQTQPEPQSMLSCVHYTNYTMLWLFCSFFCSFLQVSSTHVPSEGPFPGGIGPASGTCTAMSAGAAGSQCNAPRNIQNHSGLFSLGHKSNLSSSNFI